MSFIDQPLKDHQEKEPVPDGNYRLRVRNYKLNQREDGVVKGVLIFHEIDGEPDAKDVVFNMNLVLPEDDKDKKYWKLAFQKGYLKLFGLQWSNSGFDPEEWLGAEADVNLYQDNTNPNDPNQGDLVNRFDAKPVT